MITDFRIQNLRSIQDSGEINLKPIMILLGANSSGKSTFLHSFPLFTQSVDKKLRGPIIDSKGAVVGVAFSEPMSNGNYDEMGYGVAYPINVFYQLLKSHTTMNVAFVDAID